MKSDEDFEYVLSTDEINGIIKDHGIDEELCKVVNESIDKSGLNEERNQLEIAVLGGSLRIPYLKLRLSDLLKSINGKEKLIQTMNMDESTVRGCGYYYLQKENMWKYEVAKKNVGIKIDYIKGGNELFDDVKTAWEDERKMEINDKNINEISKYKNDIDSAMYFFSFLFFHSII